MVVEEEKKTFWVWKDPYEFEIITDELYQSFPNDEWPKGYVKVQCTQGRFDAYVAARKVYRDFRSSMMLEAGIL